MKVGGLTALVVAVDVSLVDCQSVGTKGLGGQLCSGICSLGLVWCGVVSVSSVSVSAGWTMVRYRELITTLMMSYSLSGVSSIVGRYRCGGVVSMSVVYRVCRLSVVVLALFC